jgi:hypothetical protein
MAVNSTAHFWTAKACLPSMMDNNHGHIVTIASSAGLCGTPGLADYCASKVRPRAHITHPHPPGRDPSLAKTVSPAPAPYHRPLGRAVRNARARRVPCSKVMAFSLFTRVISRMKGYIKSESSVFAASIFASPPVSPPPPRPGCAERPDSPTTAPPR